MYIDDCVKGSLDIMASDITEPLNLGSNQLVTINQLVDIVEEMIGDFQDDHYMLPLLCVKAGECWVVGGGISLRQLKDVTGIDLIEEGVVQNLSSWILNRLNKPPEGSEVVSTGNATVLVRKVRRQRVLEAALRVPAEKK